MSGTKICNADGKFGNFPVANISECNDAKGVTTDCVEKNTNNTNNTYKVRGVYDCNCPASFKLNGKDTPSTRPNQSPKITPPSGRITTYKLSCYDPLTPSAK
jgi:hypothetical protein